MRHICAVYLAVTQFNQRTAELEFNVIDVTVRDLIAGRQEVSFHTKCLCAHTHFFQL